MRQYIKIIKNRRKKVKRGREKNGSVHGFCGREYENTGGAHAAQDVRGVCGGRAGRDDIVDDHDALACELAREERLLFVCGHYEGIDERAYALADRTLSIGDYVLTSGELASMVVIDAVVRKLPGVLGAETGAEDESFHGNLLEYPQYTRPADFRGMVVPPVLTSGDHGKVALWRRHQSLLRTFSLRPDLLADADLTDDDRAFLKTLSDGKGASSAGS